MTEPTSQTRQPENNRLRYGRLAARGVVWMTLAVMLGRLTSLISQLVLGRLLTKEQFGLVALAISVGAVVKVLRDGGMQKILIQRGAEFDQLGTPILKISAIFNATAMCILLAIAPLAAKYYDEDKLVWLVFVVAAALPAQTLSKFLRARFSIQLRFRTLAQVGCLLAVIHCGTVILLAYLGAGPYSFVVPLATNPLIQALILYRIGGRWPRGLPLTFSLFRELFRSSRWIMLSVLGIALIKQGDYLVIGKIKGTAVVGVYFFAYELTFAVSAMFSQSMLSVLMPTFSKLTDDPVRQGRAYLKGVRLMSLAATPAFVLMAILADPLISILWSGKWNVAIPVTQVLAISLMVQVMRAMSISLIEARGRWRLRALLLLVDSIGTVLAAAIGAWLGGAVSCAIWVGSHRAAVALIQYAVSGRLVNLSAGALAGAPATAVVASVACGLLSYLLFEQVWEVPSHLLRALLITGTFVFSFGLLAITVMRASVAEAVEILFRKGSGESV